MPQDRVGGWATIRCPVIHGYSQVLQPPVRIGSRRSLLSRGFFIGGMNLVTKDGAVSLHDAPLELTRM